MFDQIKKQITPEIIGIRIFMWEELSFYKYTLQLLGNPVSFNFWWCESEKMLLIEGSSIPTEKSVTTPNCFYTRKGGPRIQNKSLLYTIQQLAGIPNKPSVLLTGKFIPELKMVAFRFDNLKKESVA